MDSNEHKLDSSDSGIEIQGYVFGEYLGESLPAATIFVGHDYSKFFAYSEDDGYFAGELYNTNKPLYFHYGQMLIPLELYLSNDCGLFVILKDNPENDKNALYGGSP